MCRARHLWMALLAASLLMFAGTFAQAIPVKATVTNIVGDVQVMPPGGSWQPAKDNAMLASGTQIKTGAKSSCTLRWSSQNTMKLTPYTQFTVKSIEIDPKSKTVKTEADLFMGKVKFRAEKLNNPNSKFSVSTPAAVAGVRGTEGDLGTDADGNTVGNIYDGLMDLTSKTDGSSTSIGKGQQASVPAGGSASAAKDVPPEEQFKCTENEECASGVCTNGQCAGEADAMSNGASCVGNGGESQTPEACCSGVLDPNGKCAATTTATCIEKGEDCKSGDECCSKICRNGKCRQAGPDDEEAACVKAGDTCAADADCCDNGLCQEGVCLKGEGAAISCALEMPADGDEFPLSQEKVIVDGSSIAGANCDINGNMVTAAEDGSFSAEVAFDAPGELEIGASCTDANGETAECAAVKVNVKGPPHLMISGPSPGFIDCPIINIAGQTEPGARVNVNGINVLDNQTAEQYSDGSFMVANFELQDCAAPLVFEAIDNYNQVTKLSVEAGMARDASMLGVVFDQLDVILKPTNQWMGGVTTVIAKVVVKAQQPIPYGMLVSLESVEEGGVGAGLIEGSGLINSGVIQPLAGADGAVSYYGVAEIEFQHGEAFPLTIIANVGGQTSAPSSVFLEQRDCTPTIMVQGDGLDNDCDGLMDEEIADGLDNDWDNRMDEDTMCNYHDDDVDCDKDGINNGSDCNPFDRVVAITIADAACTDAMEIASTGIMPDDGADNDFDFRVDEEFIDGMDNDGDGRVDEDTTLGCDPNYEGGDCDYDGVENGNDCKPLDSTIVVTRFLDYPANMQPNESCMARCNPYENPDMDCDSDGLSNGQELMMGLDPNAGDSDRDGYMDQYEIMFGSDPADPYSMPDSTVDYSQYMAAAECMGGVMRDGSCVCPGGPDAPDGIILPAGMNSCICFDGQVLYPDGTCYCPSGTSMNATGFCEGAEHRQCDTMEYMDWNLGYCVTICSGGQVADASTRECYCAGGFMDPTSGECVTAAAGCPAPFVMNVYTNMCECPEATPYFDMVTESCAAECSQGQVADPYSGQCFCPEGTYFDWAMRTCVETTSTTICPPGTSGMGCDYGRMGDCDWDGMMNYDDDDPCLTSVSAGGGFVCPADTHGAGCDPSDDTQDCDNDSQGNFYDPCPCMFGMPNDDYCPGAVTDCPAGMYADSLSGVCVETCPPGFIAEGTACMCAPGTYMDPVTGYCQSGCPAGMETTADGGCACGAAAPYWDNSSQGCVATCGAGMEVSPYYPECVCPAGSYFDYMTQTCTAMDGCTTAPLQYGCACSTSSECMSQFCDPYAGSCVPPAAGCDGIDADGDGFLCEPWVEDALGCSSDCTCGDMICDNYEYNAKTCGSDCGTFCPNGCDYNVFNGDCDGDGVLNQMDANGCIPEGDANACPPMTEGEGCNPFIYGDCDMDSIDNMSDYCPCNTGTIENNGCQPSGFICGDAICDFSLGESNYSCPGDCACDYDNVCDESAIPGDPGSEAGEWCGDCIGASCFIDGFCDYPSEDANSCLDDCACDNSGTCDAGESYYWCYGDCTTCTTAGMPSINFGYDCCYAFDQCTQMCANEWPLDTDYDGLPDGCDGCPMEPGYANGCPGAVTDCTMFMDPMGCTSDPAMMCEWDPTTQGCRVAPPPDCVGVLNDMDCSMMMGCYWDYSFNECRMSGGAMCSTYVDSSTCYGDMNCMWDSMNGICVSNQIGTCPTYQEPVSCEMDMGCMWDTNQALCVMKQITGCGDYMDSGSCSMNPDCVWDYTNGVCNILAGCSDITVQYDCDINAGCAWDGTTGTCQMDCGSMPYADGCTCATSGDCASGLCGIDYTCQQDPCGMYPYGLGCACTMHNECNSGLCDDITFTCADPCQGTPPFPTSCGCSSNMDCSSGYCDPGTSVCMMDPCGMPPYQLGCACMTNMDCASGLCDGTCLDSCGSIPMGQGCTCSSNTDCVSGFCDTGTSQCAIDCSAMPMPNGCTCSTGTDCSSSFCNPCSSWCETYDAAYDGDGDGVPDGCDSCPATFGDIANNGCAIACPTCP